jgi:hypothetical protein
MFRQPVFILLAIPIPADFPTASKVNSLSAVKKVDEVIFITEIFEVFTMIRLFVTTVAFLAAVAVAHAQELSEAEKRDGFRLLFDGKSFDGWKTSDKTPKSWKIEDGLLKLTGGSSQSDRPLPAG